MNRTVVDGETFFPALGRVYYLVPGTPLPLLLANPQSKGLEFRVRAKSLSLKELEAKSRKRLELAWALGWRFVVGNCACAARAWVGLSGAVMISDIINKTMGIGFRLTQVGGKSKGKRKRMIANSLLYKNTETVARRLKNKSKSPSELKSPTHDPFFSCRRKIHRLGLLKRSIPIAQQHREVG